MNAWQNLLAASSLTVGSAWDLITNPKIGGFGNIYNTGAEAIIDSSPIGVTISSAVDVSIANTTLVVEINNTSVETIVSPDIIGIVVDTSPISI